MVTFKRKRRTKREMEEYRASLLKQIPEEKPAEIIKPSIRTNIAGWINIQRHKVRNIIGYYTGADIHETQEQARKVATENTLGQVYIDLEINK